MQDLAQSRRAGLVDRWPSALGVVLAAAGIVVIAMTDHVVAYFLPVVVMMAGIYLVTFAIGPPGVVWLAGAVFSTVIAALLALDAAKVLPVDPATGMVGVVVLAWLWTVARRRFADGTTFSVQTAGFVGFGAVSVVGTAVAPRLALLLTGVGFFAHGLWDAYHFRARKVVARSWAEFCGVVDITVGPALIVAALVKGAPF